jgi:2-methylcitrate dehydratase PrpD
LSASLSQWVAGVGYADLPADVVADTKLRILDVIGLSVAGGTTPFGAGIREAGRSLYSSGPARLFGTNESTGIVGAAFVNGSLSQALEFDDTHNRSIVHMSGPAVVTALAFADAGGVGGRDVIRAIAISNEIATRIGSAAPGQFHKRGFHPTGLFAPFGVCWSAGALLRLEAEQMVNAAGIVGSFSAGLLECWVDGTQSKFVHPGWSAQGGIHAAFLARSGITGPREVLEGRFGLFASHLQSSEGLDLTGITADLGSYWESQNASFKPYPVAHVIHPYIDAALQLQRDHGFTAADIAEITCTVAPYIVGIVCEPRAEKCRPNTDSHGRVSMQFTIAEALALGRLDKNSYAPASLRDPEVLALADKVAIEIDPGFPGPEQFKGQVRISLQDGRELAWTQEFNRGSRQNPMSTADLIAKFERNVAGVIAPAAAARLADAVLSIETLEDASGVTALARPSA